MINILSYHFAGRGYPSQIVLYWLVGLVVNLAINVALLPAEGTYIASLSSSVTYALLFGLIARLFAREAGGFRALVPQPLELVRTMRAAFASLRR
jgi:O-antigen/teichoic acid export membrane protein